MARTRFGEHVRRRNACPDFRAAIRLGSTHVRGLVTTPGTRYYQVWYRNAASFCTSSTFNLTNMHEVQWVL